MSSGLNGLYLGSGYSLCSMGHVSTIKLAILFMPGVTMNSPNSRCQVSWLRLTDDKFSSSGHSVRCAFACAFAYACVPVNPRRLNCHVSFPTDYRECCATLLKYLLYKE